METASKGQQGRDRLSEPKVQTSAPARLMRISQVKGPWLPDSLESLWTPKVQTHKGESLRYHTESNCQTLFTFIQSQFLFRRYLSMKVLPNLKYAPTDEWVRVEGQTAIIGVTDFAQSQLSDIVYLEFKVEPGEQVQQNTPCATMESVKAAADVNLPVSGEVIEINEALTETFEKINSDPYGEAWLVKVTMSNPAQLDGLMDAETYEKYCQERGH
jgi:glycine cleavage system H protein